jgi:hypothetical protein
LPEAICDHTVTLSIRVSKTCFEDRFALMRKQMVEQDIEGRGVMYQVVIGEALLPAEPAVFK